MIPVDETGWGEISDDMIPDKPEDLLNKWLDFAVSITRASDLPANLCKDVYVEYKFYLDEQPYSTSLPGKHWNPIFDYRYHHTVPNVTENLIKYLKENAICFKVFGFPDNTISQDSTTISDSRISKISDNSSSFDDTWTSEKDIKSISF